MVEAALRASSVEVWAYLELRYHAPFLAMHELVAAGQIGEVVSLQATLPHRLRSLPRTAQMLDSERKGGLPIPHCPCHRGGSQQERQGTGCRGIAAMIAGGTERVRANRMG